MTSIQKTRLLAAFLLVSGIAIVAYTNNNPDSSFYLHARGEEAVVLGIILGVLVGFRRRP
jgi:uncharacterized membrane protein YadS